MVQVESLRGRRGFLREELSQEGSARDDAQLLTVQLPTHDVTT